MHTDEEKKEYGAQELEVLKMMFERWMKSDITWAAGYIQEHGNTGEEGEWDFVREDWVEKFGQWIRPYLNRLEETEYITRQDWIDYNDWAYETMDIMLAVLYKLGEENDGG